MISRALPVAGMQRIPGLLLISLLLSAFGGALAFALLPRYDVTSVVVALSGYSLACAGVLLAFLAWRRTRLLLGLIYVSWVFVYHFLPDVLLAPVGGVNFYREWGEFVYDQLPAAMFAAGVFCAVFGLVFFLTSEFVRGVVRPSPAQALRSFLSDVPLSLLVTWVVAAAFLTPSIYDTNPTYLRLVLFTYPIVAVLALMYIKVYTLASLRIMTWGLAVLVTIIPTAVFLLRVSSRLSVLTALLVTYLVVSLRRGRAIPRIFTTTAMIAVVVLMTGLVVVRASVGREKLQDASLSEIVSSAKWNGDALAQVYEDFAYRFDGNLYLTKLLDTGTPFNLQAFEVAVRLAVPSALWPSKTEQALALRNVETNIAVNAGMKNPTFDYLPSPVGVAFGTGNWWFIPLFALFLGLTTAFLGFVAARSNRTATVIFTVAVLAGVLNVEGDLTSFTIGLRNAFMLISIFGLVGLAVRTIRILNRSLVRTI